jgi:hypothetical protein
MRHKTRKTKVMTTIKSTTEKTRKMALIHLWDGSQRIIVIKTNETIEEYLDRNNIDCMRYLPM